MTIELLTDLTMGSLTVGDRVLLMVNVMHTAFQAYFDILVRLSGLQCFNMGHNGHGINLYGVIMTLMEN